MGTTSKVVLVCLRIWQLICSAIVLGILAAFVYRVSDADGPSDGRVIYGLVTAAISTAFSILFMAPFRFSFMAFPGDFILWIMWLVAFCLLDTRTGIHTCSSPWFWNYWGFYWGRRWRRPLWVSGPVSAGCAQWRTVLGFSFMAMFSFIVTTILGGYVACGSRDKKRERNGEETEGMATKPETSQFGGPVDMGSAPQAGGVTYVGPPPGQPGTYPPTGQSGTYA